jgi:hypothetical protein
MKRLRRGGRTKSEGCEDMITVWCLITDEALQASWEISEEDAWREEGEEVDGSFENAVSQEVLPPSPLSSGPPAGKSMQ